jgi:hypothetical protein
MRTYHACVLHLLDTLLRENDGIFPSKDYMILSSVIFVLSDPSFLELFKGLGVLGFDLIDPLSWR